MSDSCDRPSVSIILPTCNRAKFLPQSFASIRSQTFTDWELIVVDDGSVDDTSELVEGLTKDWDQPVRYVRQENQGAYGARNTGLSMARGEFVAFFDSDDVWLAHHLCDCVAGLRLNPDVDWVYSASRIVNHEDGSVLNPNCFYVQGVARPFLQLKSRRAGKLNVIEDERAVEYALSHGLFAGLQTSVVRRGVFAAGFEAANRNAEDQLAVIQALAAGRKLAYIDAVHLVYYIHGQNSSAPGSVAAEKHVRVFRTLTDGFEGLRRRVELTPRQARALDRRLSREYFWHLGYHLFGQPGYRADALAWMRRGLRLWPLNVTYWRVYVFALLRHALRRTCAVRGEVRSSPG